MVSGSAGTALGQILRWSDLPIGREIMRSRDPEILASAVHRRSLASLGMTGNGISDSLPSLGRPSVLRPGHRMRENSLADRRNHGLTFLMVKPRSPVPAK